MPDTQPSVPDAARITKLGKLGEFAFSTWATQADFVVNPSEQDEAGWDFIVELAPGDAASDVPSIPAHHETFSFRGRVQVKATDSTAGFVDIKLSNWLRMVDDPQPTYFAILEFDGKDAPQRAYIVHVGEDLIRRVLQRSHQNAIRDAKALNKIKMRLTYDDGNRLDPMDGAAVRGRLLAGMKEGGETWAGYATWKGGLVHTAGFEGGNVQVRVTIPVEQEDAPDPVALMADLETGILPSIKVSGAELFRTRFGLVDPTPFATRGPSFLQAVGARSDIWVNIEVRAAGTTARQRVIGAIRAPSGLGPAIQAKEDLSSFKTRVHAPHLEIVADFQNRNGTFHAATPDKGDVVKARTVKLHADLASVVSTAIKRDTGIEMEVTHGSDVLMQFAIDNDQVDAFGDAEAAAEVLGRYVTLCSQFDVIDEANVALDQIESRQEAMRTFSTYADDANRLEDFSFTLVPSDEGRERAVECEGERVVALSPWAVTLGSHTFVVVLAAWGTLEKVREHGESIDYRIVGDPILRVARFACEGTIEDVPLWQLITDAAHVAKEREDTGRLIVLGVEPTGEGALTSTIETPDDDSAPGALPDATAD